MFIPSFVIVSVIVMTPTRTLLNQTSNQIEQYFYLHKNFFFEPLENLYRTMSNALVRELDIKMQQVKEYGLIAHGYHNENFQYPIHVRRSHDGEKLVRRFVTTSDSTVLTPSSHENRTTKIKTKDSSTRHSSIDEHQYRTQCVPPNKTINDINPTLNSTHRQSSLSSINSSPILSSNRPHSVTSISLPATDQTQRNSLSNSSQSLINPSPPTKSLTQRFFSKLFHHPSKSS